jgi:hypothetical protein
MSEEEIMNDGASSGNNSEIAVDEEADDSEEE